jgi:hypothetical protein
MTEITVHRVPFRGTRGGTGPFTWGQLDMWAEARLSMAGLPSFANVLGGGPLPPGLKTDQVLEAFGRLVERHESLRTRFRPGPGGDAARPEQEVLRAGELAAEVAAVDPDQNIFAIVGGWWPQMQDTPYDLVEGLPFRIRIGTVGDEPVMVMFGMSHMASDFLGTRVVYGELLDLLEGREPEGGAAQPLDLAEEERSAAGRRVLERALDHWRAALDAAPPAMFPTPSRTPEEARYWRGDLCSQTAARALRRAADRCGAGTSNVLLALTAALVGAHTGLDRCAMRMPSGNRGRPELRRMVSTLSQETPLVVDLRAGTLQEVVAAARTASLHAQRNARYDPEPVAAIRDGSATVLDVCFNDMWTPVCAGRPAAEPAAPPAESTFEWNEKVDRATVALFLEAFEVLEDPEAIRLSLFADTAHLSPARIRSFLDAIERLLVVFAERDVRLDEIDPVS